jgi:hypothetical protein
MSHKQLRRSGENKKGQPLTLDNKGLGKIYK